MPKGKTRALLATTAAIALVIAVPAVGPAFADDPPLVWTMEPGYPVTTPDGVTVSWESSTSMSSPFDSQEMLDPMLVYRPGVVNGSAETRYFAFGTDLSVQGTVEPLWLPTPWGAFTDEMEDADLFDLFWFELAAGADMDSVTQQSSLWIDGMPSWSGHTIALYELSAAPVDGVTPTATVLGSVTTPGRHVPADLSDGDIDNLSALLGQRATVAGGAGAPELYAGLVGTVEATGLPPNEALELWVTAGTNYAYFQLIGGSLPIGSVKVGSAVVGSDGTLSTAFVLPGDLAPGGYQLVAGVRAERYWPAGSYDDFTVLPRPVWAPDVVSAPVPQGASETLSLASATTHLGATSVSVVLPGETTAGTTFAVYSATGPVPSGFALASDPPLYVHITSTVELGGDAEVCVEFEDAAISGPPPELFHFNSVTSTWEEITSSQTLEAGVWTVCGLTSGFSPFTLGYPEAVGFDFSGFFDPVSMTSANVAKAGQAIPVKFSLGGDQGPDVVSSVRFVAEGTTAHPDGEELEVVSAGKSGLSYDAATDRYTFVWKTQKAWAQKTGRFVMELSDGSVHEFDIAFKK